MAVTALCARPTPDTPRNPQLKPSNPLTPPPPPPPSLLCARSMAGVTSKNVRPLAEAMHAVTKGAKQ